MNTLGIISILGICSGAGYIIGQELGKTEKEKQKNAELGFCIGAGIGILGLIALDYYTKNKSNTLNYTLHHRRKRVYDGVCFTHRFESRIKEHSRSGKLFDKATFDEAKPRIVALNLERELIQKFQPKYNIHHNCTV